MRIECQKCSAAYAIDDRLVTSKGVRAQCPRCRHLQLVKREEGKVAPSPALAMVSGLGGQPAPVEAPGPPPVAPMPAAPPNRVSAPPAPRPFDLDAPAPTLGGGPTERSALDDFLESAPPATNPSMKRVTLPPQAEAEDAPRPTAPVQAVLGCRECGKPLMDSFDQALGLCDSCRAKASPQPDEATQDSLLPAPAESARHGQGPVAGQEGGAEPAFVGNIAPVRTTDQGARRAQLGQRIAMIVVALVVVGVGGAAIAKRTWNKKAPTLAVQTHAGPIDDIIRRWKVQHTDLKGTSGQHLAAGEAALSLDATGAYLTAEDEFQKALMLDPKSDVAVAGYVRALALGRGPRMDDATYQEALGLISAAEGRSGGAPRVLIAHAELLLARPSSGNGSDARALAERAIVSGSVQEKAQGYLAVGQSYLGQNVVWASEAFEKALALDAKLKRGYYFRAQAYASEGDYRKAIESLEKRLALEPDQWEATDSLARFYLEVGEVDKARRTYQRAVDISSTSTRAKISLAMIAFQHLGKVQEGIDLLRGLSRDREKFEERDVVDLLVQLAAAERQLGQGAAAQQDSADALAIVGSSPAAHLQAFLLALDRNQVAQAKTHLPFLVGHLDDAGLEELMKGRLLFSEGKFDEARTVLAHANELDPRRTDALLFAGAAAASAKRDTAAYELVLSRGLVADPGRSGPRPMMAEFYVSAADVIQPAVGRFLSLSTGADDPNPDLAEGLVQFHLKSLGEADKQLSRAVGIDPSNAPGHMLKAIIALQHGDKAGALKESGRSLEPNRGYALGHFARGLAFMASGKDELAVKEMRDALAQDPKLLGPRVKLGELLRTRSPEEAKKMLITVVGLDPTYPGAKRALYLLDR